MQAALRTAGFVGVDYEGPVIHARLWSSSVEFVASPEGDAWVLAVQWPVRASPSQLAGWNAQHPFAPMEIYLGETRVTMRVGAEDTAALHTWAAVAESMVAQAIRWRRAQRAPGEGM